MTREAQRDVCLWAGLLVGPLTVLVNLEADFALAPWVCANGWYPALWAVQFTSLALAAAAAFLAWFGWRVGGLEWPGEAASRLQSARFMGAMGMAISGICFLQILGSIIMSFVVGACQ